MAQDDVAQIRVGKYTVGVTGLKKAMEDMAQGFAERPDEETQGELLNRLRKQNYIPDAAQENYKKAFLREFRKFLGRPSDEDAPAGLEIKILGPGCSRCDGLEREVIEAMAELGLAGEVEHVRDIKSIAQYGVMGSPALIINGKVKCVGSVPPRRKILEWLREVSNSGVME